MARILVVDDDLPVRALLLKTLSQRGHVVAEATNGREGWLQLQVGNFDLVLLDLIMPEMEGLETIRRVRGAGLKTKILAMSGGGRTGAENILKMARMLGAVDALEKPFTLEELLAAVEKSLASGGAAAT